MRRLTFRGVAMGMAGRRAPSLCRLLGVLFICGSLPRAVAAAERIEGSTRNDVAIAIIEDKGGHQLRPSTFPVLEGLFLGLDNCRFIERTEVDRVLSEQGLSLSGNTAPDSAIKVGELLAADMLLFVSSMIVDDVSLVQLTLTETRTGFNLAFGTVKEADVLDGDDYLKQLISNGLSKARMADKDRCYVALLAFQNEEPGSFLEPTADLVRFALQRDLTSCSRVVVLDRTHLNFLRREEDLSGKFLDIQNAVILVRGGVKRSADEDLLLSLRFENIENMPIATVEETIPMGAPLSRRQSLFTHVADKALSEHALELSIGDPRKESELFALQAQWHLSHEELSRAAQAAQAADVLFPSRSHKKLLIDVWQTICELNFVRYPHDSPRSGGSSSKVERLRELSEEKKRTIIRNEIQESILVLQYLDQYPAATLTGHESPPTYEMFSPACCGGLFIPVRAENSELYELQGELRRLRIDLFRKAIASIRQYYPAEHSSRGIDLSWQEKFLLSCGMQMAPYWSRNVNEYSVLLKAIIARWTEDASFHTDRRGYIRDQAAFVDDMVESWQKMAEISENSSDSKDLDTLLTWIIEQPSSYLKIGAYRLRDTPQAAAKITALLDESPYYKYKYGMTARYFASTFEGCVSVYAPEVIDEFCGPIIQDLLAAKDATKNTMLLDIIEPYFRSYIRWDKEHGVEREKKRLLQEQASSLYKVTNEAYDIGYNLSYWTPKLACLLRGFRDYFSGGKTHAAVLDVNTWMSSEFKFRRMVVTPPKGFVGIVKQYADSNSLYCVWKRTRVYAPYHPKYTERFKGAMSIGISRTRLHGGVTEFLGEIAIDISDAEVEWITSLAVHGGVVALGTREHGLIVCEGGMCRRFTEEEGLPSNDVASLAWLDGLLYIGHGSIRSVRWGDDHSTGGGLSWYDPEKDSFQLIFSSKSTQREYELDGGKSYAIPAMLAGKRGHALWLVSTDSYGSSAQSLGVPQILWKYYPAEKKLTKVRGLGLFESKRGMQWVDDLIFMNSNDAFAVLDPADNKLTFLTSWNYTNSYGSATKFYPWGVIGQYFVVWEKRRQLRFYYPGGAKTEAIESFPNGPALNLLTSIIRLADGSLSIVIDQSDVWRLEKTSEDVVDYKGLYFPDDPSTGAAGGEKVVKTVPSK